MENNVPNSTANHDDESVGELRICIVGKKLPKDERLMNAVKGFDFPLMFSENGTEFTEDNLMDNETGFVVDDFAGDAFNSLKKLIPVCSVRIWGPALLIQLAEGGFLPPSNPRPLYCMAMQNLIVCFTGFPNRNESVRKAQSQLVKMVHHMGGSIRKDISHKVTHLVANVIGHDKYKYAVSMAISIMSQDWILESWKRRDEIGFSATDQELMKFKLQPFYKCRIVFVGFSPEEQKHVEELTEANGGIVTTREDERCTHVVVEEQNVSEIEEVPSKAHVVRAEWFWATIQMDACADESIYVHKQCLESPTCKGTPTMTTFGSGAKLRKRKRLKETLGQLAQLPDAGSGDHRQSTDTLGTSFSDSFLDATTSPDRNSIEGCLTTENVTAFSPTSVKPLLDLKLLTARQQVCLELLQTENNYVGILNIIMSKFKVPLEVVDQVRGPLLDPAEVKIIFGNLSPIFEVHKKIREDLTILMANWKENCSLGDVILKHSQELLKAYPPFINFFENTKEMIQTCDRSKPRFHAFLKICQSKPDCGRQTLSELLIRPVQRLPSVILLLNDILKHTDKRNPDHPRLEEAVDSLKEVLKHINEDKRKTESQLAMFDIINDIENCPPNLLSSHRQFVTKVDVIELSDSISGKGDNLTIFVFSDVLEICKRRTKLLATLKSPSSASLVGVRSQQKFYKHIELMPLSHVKRVVDIIETDECHSVFALVCRSNQELKEKLHSFAIVSGSEVNKMDFLRIVCRHVANTICRADVENFLTSLQPQELDIVTSEVATNSLSKAMSRLASKTTRKVGRAFSFNRTPGKLKRAMSTMISPFHPPLPPDHRTLGSSSSVADLQEMDLPTGSSSAKIQKKIKSSSFSASATKLI